MPFYLGMHLFDFDPRKSASNKAKHGIDFVEAQVLWKGRVVQIPANIVEREVRYANLGVINGRHWTAIVTYRGNVRRIISVYPSNERQARRYQASKPEKS